MPKRAGLVLLISCMLLSCATSYKREGWKGGYSEIQISEDAYQVRFKGNGYTSKQKAADFCLLRCAELCIERGYAHFIIVDEEAYVSESEYTTPTETKTEGTVTGYGNWASVKSKSTTTGGQTYHISKPRSMNTIVCFKSKPEGILSYYATLVANQIMEKYGITPVPHQSK